MIRYRPNPDHFSLLDILGHLIHGEEDDWIPRLQLMLKQDHPTYTPFDRFAHKQFIDNFTIAELLDLFEEKRQSNVDVLRDLSFDPSILKRTANHPALGSVTVVQLLHTWVNHDLSHINQMNRILSILFDDVGPWKEYLRIKQEI